MGWLILLSLAILFLFRWRKLNKRWTRLHGGIFIGLFVLLPLTNLFIIVRFPVIQELLSPAQALRLGALGVPILAATAWVMAAGLLGVLSAAGFGLISGALIALTSTHNPFTVLEYGLLAIFLAASFHQRYRTWVFRLLRRPLFSTALFALVYPLLFILDSTLYAQGSLAVRLDLALSQVEISSLTVGLQLLVAGVIGEATAILFPRLWGFTGH